MWTNDLNDTRARARAVAVEAASLLRSFDANEPTYRACITRACCCQYMYTAGSAAPAPLGNDFLKQIVIAYSARLSIWSIQAVRYRGPAATAGEGASREGASCFEAPPRLMPGITNHESGCVYVSPGACIYRLTTTTSSSLSLSPLSLSLSLTILCTSTPRPLSLALSVPRLSLYQLQRGRGRVVLACSRTRRSYVP